MKTSTEIGSIARRVGYERAIELVAKAGFDAWDFSMFDFCSYDRANDIVIEKDERFCGEGYLGFAKKLGELGRSLGIHCNQSHAPFPSVPKMIPYIKRAIECTAAAGGKICIVHPWNYSSPEENAQMYKELLPLAKKLGVKIATENMWNWDKEKDVAAPAACSLPENFTRHMELVDDEDFVACLDIGHAEMFRSYTSAPELIRTLGRHLQALHLHDNDGWHDSHAIPFTMDIDFDAVVKALYDIGYTGYFTLEAVTAGDTDDVEGGVRDMYRATRRLADMFEALA